MSTTDLQASVPRVFRYVEVYWFVVSSPCLFFLWVAFLVAPPFCSFGPIGLRCAHPTVVFVCCCHSPCRWGRSSSVLDEVLHAFALLGRSVPSLRAAGVQRSSFGMCSRLAGEHRSPWVTEVDNWS